MENNGVANKSKSGDIRPFLGSGEHECGRRISTIASTSVAITIAGRTVNAI